MMRMMMTRCELRSGGGRGWRNFVNLLSSISLQWLILRSCCDCERITFLACGFHAFSRCSLVVIIITPDATRKTFQLTQSNRTAHCMEGIFIVHKPTSVETPTTRTFHESPIFSQWRWFTHDSNVFNILFPFHGKRQKRNFNSRKMMMIFFNALASSLLRALRNFQFLFCALSIQCRMANVAAWIKQIVYTLITTHSPG